MKIIKFLSENNSLRNNLRQKDIVINILIPALAFSFLIIIIASIWYIVTHCCSTKHDVENKMSETET